MLLKMFVMISYCIVFMLLPYLNIMFQVICFSLFDTNVTFHIGRSNTAQGGRQDMAWQMEKTWKDYGHSWDVFLL